MRIRRLHRRDAKDAENERRNQRGLTTDKHGWTQILTQRRKVAETQREQARSAGFQPAVSQSFQPAECATFPASYKHSMVCRLEIGDTAGWKPALHQPASRISLISFAVHFFCVTASATDSRLLWYTQPAERLR